MTAVVEAPQPVLDRIVDRLIEDSPSDAGFRWVYELDACRLDWRQRDGLCPCGAELDDVDVQEIGARVRAASPA